MQALDEPEEIIKGKRSTLYTKLTVTKEMESFITLTPGVNVIKLFSFITDDKAQ